MLLPLFLLETPPVGVHQQWVSVAPGVDVVPRCYPVARLDPAKIDAPLPDQSRYRHQDRHRVDRARGTKPSSSSWST